MSTGAKIRLAENPKRGSLQRSLPLCSPPLSFSGAGRAGFMVSKSLKATPTPRVPISRNRGVGVAFRLPNGREENHESAALRGPRGERLPQEDQAVSTGQRSGLCREPQEGSSTAIFAPVLTAAVVLRGRKSRIHGFKELKADPTPRVPISRKPGRRGRLQAPKREKREP